jgi:subtilase family serine protease
LTTLNQATATGVRDASETAWSGAGSGCSVYDPKPSWQQDLGCAMRTVADVSAVADPATPVWTYDTYPYNNTTLNWDGVGGTSAASPIVAAMYALAGGPSGSSYHPAGDPYAEPGSLNDITSGSTVHCNGTYLCTAGAGYDGPTGLGTPDGIRAFQPSAPTSPTDVTAGSQANTVVLGWSPPGINGGATISAFHIYRADQGSTPIASVSGTVSSYTDHSVTNGTSYTYTVTAVNALGESAASVSVSATPAPLDHIVISPATATITAGRSQTYTAQGFDAADNSLGNETPATTFSVTPDGSCTGTTCTTTVAGAHTVTGAVAPLGTTGN